MNTLTAAELLKTLIEELEAENLAVSTFAELEVVKIKRQVINRGMELLTADPLVVISDRIGDVVNVKEGWGKCPEHGVFSLVEQPTCPVCPEEAVISL